MKTHAAVCREFGKDLVIEEIDIRAPGPGEVGIRTEAVAICHSDVYFVDGAWGGKLPAVYGHEAAGVVDVVGPGVTHVAPGDRVVVSLIRSCGHCHYCAAGTPVLCEVRFALDNDGPLTAADGTKIGHGLRTGAFARYLVVEGSQVVAVPPEFKPENAALLACGVITGYGAVTNSAGVPAGADVVVIGAGGVGLNSVQGARISGARTVIALDVAQAKLAAALAFGATHALDARAADIVAEVKALTGGRGADYAFVTVGAKSAFEQAFHLINKGGNVVIVGMPPTGVMTQFDPGNFADWGQRVIGSKMGSARLPVDIPRLVELHRQGRLKLDELISGRFPFDEINEAIAGARNGTALRNVVMF